MFELQSKLYFDFKHGISLRLAKHCGTYYSIEIKIPSTSKIYYEKLDIRLEKIKKQGISINDMYSLKDNRIIRVACLGKTEEEIIQSMNSVFER